MNAQEFHIFRHFTHFSIFLSSHVFLESTLRSRRNKRLPSRPSLLPLLSLPSYRYRVFSSPRFPDVVKLFSRRKLVPEIWVLVSSALFTRGHGPPSLSSGEDHAAGLYRQVSLDFSFFLLFPFSFFFLHHHDDGESFLNERRGSFLRLDHGRSTLAELYARLSLFFATSGRTRRINFISAA